MRQLLRTISRLRNSSIGFTLATVALVVSLWLALIVGCDYISFDNRYSDLDDANIQNQTLVVLPLERLPNMRTNIEHAGKFIEPLDADSIEMFNYRGSKSYHPVNLIHRTLAFIAAFHESSDSLFLYRAEQFTEKLLSLALETDSALFLPYNFRYAVHADSNNTFEVPWYSGMAQGEFLMVLARLFEITKKNKYAIAGEKTLNSLTLLQSSGHWPWVSRIDSLGYYWIEEYPHDDHPGRTLNGYMAAVFGLYEHYRVTKSPLAKTLFDLSLTTFKHYLPLYRTSGINSLYCLEHNHRASDGYHQLHINMLIHLSDMTGDPFFRIMKDVFELDKNNPNN